MTCVVGFLDALTGYELNFFIFYLAPVSIAAWHGSKKMGLFIAGLSGFIWVLIDLYSGHEYSHFFIPFWNGGIRMSVFVIMAIALSNLKTQMDLRELNAYHDSLTGLLNSLGFREKAEPLLQFVKRNHEHYSLAFIDLDNFKHVNDTLGHAEGDLVLKNVGLVMAENLRKSDLVCRMGGDEFIILLPNLNEMKVRKVLDDLKIKMGAMAKENKWPIGFSIGVGIFNGSRTPLEDAIAQADALMYDVKRHGKNAIFYKDFSISATENLQDFEKSNKIYLA